jgi:hypothetical protein
MKPLVIVSGALATKPGNGGNAWSRMSWARGFERLGCEVWFIEQLPAAAERGVHAASINFFQAVTAQFGLAQNSALLCGNEILHGPPLTELVKRAKESALLFNLSGHLTQPEIFSAARCKLYYDDDPGFTQFWHAQGAALRLAEHDFHFTIGENIGLNNFKSEISNLKSDFCPIPTGEIKWRHTRAPVVLADWPVCAPKTFDRFTTIASWRGAFGPVTHEGKTYGLKCHEFRKFFALPQRVKQICEVALQIHHADKKDLDALLAHGWRVIEPQTVAHDCDSFRRYVQNSAAEFSPAQGIYVDTNSGWFSDRTVRYLASGRPALVQETGFSRHIKTGAGLLSFRNLEEAVAGAEKISGDYARHCRAAREIAEEFFDADKIIRKLANEIGLALP